MLVGNPRSYSCQRFVEVRHPKSPRPFNFKMQNSSSNFSVDSLMGKKDFGNQNQVIEKQDLSQDERKSAFSITQFPKREFHVPNLCNCQPCQQNPVASFTAVSQTGMAAIGDHRFMPLQTVAAVSVPAPVYIPKGKSMFVLVKQIFN